MKTNNKFRSRCKATHGDYHRMFKKLSKRLERRSAKTDTRKEINND